MRIHVLEPLGIPTEKLRGMLEEAVGEQMQITLYPDRVTDPATLIERSREADVVVLSNLPYPKEVLAQCPNLKLVNVAFTGVDLVDTAYCREKGITVCNCAGYSTVAVADLVFGMVLELARRLRACDQAVRAGKTKDGLVGFELEGKRFGIIGTGAIGMRVAQIAKAFGCEVCAYSRTQKSGTDVTYLPLDELLKTSDIVSLHVPATAETTNLIGAAQFALMKQDALLINTARGAVVDSAALAQALHDHKLAGAGIDVFETEPPLAQAHPLLQAPNVIAAPHVAFATDQSMEKRAAIVCENVKAWLAGHPQNVIG